MVKYSICMTQYNEIQTVEASLRSIIQQVNSEFEIVVVDNFSTDGSYEKLQDIARADDRIRLIQAHCTRGKGRQIAFAHSRGNYILANVDADDCFKPRLVSLLRFYHALCEGKLLWIRAMKQAQLEEFRKRVGTVDPRKWGWTNVMVLPRSVAERVGGWPDVNNAEDEEIAFKAAQQDLYRWSAFDLLKTKGLKVKRRGRTKRFFERWKGIVAKTRMRIAPDRELSNLERIGFLFVKTYATLTRTPRNGFDKMNWAFYVDSSNFD